VLNIALGSSGEMTRYGGYRLVVAELENVASAPQLNGNSHGNSHGNSNEDGDDDDEVDPYRGGSFLRFAGSLASTWAAWLGKTMVRSYSSCLRRGASLSRCTEDEFYDAGDEEVKEGSLRGALQFS